MTQQMDDPQRLQANPSFALQRPTEIVSPAMAYLLQQLDPIGATAFHGLIQIGAIPEQISDPERDILQVALSQQILGTLRTRGMNDLAGARDFMDRVGIKEIRLPEQEEALLRRWFPTLQANGTAIRWFGEGRRERTIEENRERMIAFQEAAQIRRDADMEIPDEEVQWFVDNYQILSNLVRIWRSPNIPDTINPLNILLVPEIIRLWVDREGEFFYIVSQREFAQIQQQIANPSLPERTTE